MPAVDVVAKAKAANLKPPAFVYAIRASLEQGEGSEGAVRGRSSSGKPSKSEFVRSQPASEGKWCCRRK
jgi:hypothetical protein